MSLLMFDLVAKAQGKIVVLPLHPDSKGLYLYKREFKSLRELARIGGIPSSTLLSRFQRTTYATIEEAVHAPIRGKYRSNQVSGQL